MKKALLLFLAFSLLLTTLLLGSFAFAEEAWKNLYKAPGYELFTVPSSESGLDGLRLRIEGIVESTEKMGDIVCVFITDENGNKWAAAIQSNVTVASKLEIICYGEFLGISKTFNDLPTVLVLRYEQQDATFELSTAEGSVAQESEKESFLDKKATVLGEKNNQKETPAAQSAGNKEEAFSLDARFEYGEFDFKNVSRRPESYIGNKVRVTGQVVQALGDRSTGYDIRLATKGSYDDIIYCVIPSINTPDYNILEDDTIIIYCELRGSHTYETTLGGSVTLPIVYVDSVELVE
jgi:hypothetical protein